MGYDVIQLDNISFFDNMSQLNPDQALQVESEDHKYYAEKIRYVEKHLDGIVRNIDNYNTGDTICIINHNLVPGGAVRIWRPFSPNGKYIQIATQLYVKDQTLPGHIQHQDYALPFPLKPELPGAEYWVTRGHNMYLNLTPEEGVTSMKFSFGLNAPGELHSKYTDSLTLVVDNSEPVPNIEPTNIYNSKALLKMQVTPELCLKNFANVLDETARVISQWQTSEFMG